MYTHVYGTYMYIVGEHACSTYIRCEWCVYRYMVFA